MPPTSSPTCGKARCPLRRRRRRRRPPDTRTWQRCAALSLPDEEVEPFAVMIAPFSKKFPGLAPPGDTPLSPGQLSETLGSLAAARIGLVAATRGADVLPLIGWTPSDQSDALPVAAV